MDSNYTLPREFSVFQKLENQVFLIQLNIPQIFIKIRLLDIKRESSQSDEPSAIRLDLNRPLFELLVRNGFWEDLRGRQFGDQMSAIYIQYIRLDEFISVTDQDVDQSHDALAEELVINKKITWHWLSVGTSFRFRYLRMSFMLLVSIAPFTNSLNSSLISKYQK